MARRSFGCAQPRRSQQGESDDSEHATHPASAHDQATQCSSTQSSCAGATATGSCALPPGFNGLTSASSAGTAACAVALAWPGASSNCGGSTLRYNVYRSTSADFTPGPANLLHACLTGTTLNDGAVVSGVQQHYLVRAEDLSAAPANGRCGGVEDANLVIRSVTPAGPDLGIFADDVEGGAGNWTVGGSGGGANFAIVSTAAQSPTRSWFVPDPSVVSDRQLSLTTPIALAPGSSTVLEFAHRYTTEPGFDGGVLEYSLDAGTTWTDILAGQGGVAANSNRFLAGGYVGALQGGTALGTRAAWFGTAASFATTRVSLADFAGQAIRVRFRFASDSSVGSTGWWIDDIRVLESSSCSTGDSVLIFHDGFEPR
jgi:lysyl endopeptidase